MVRQKQLGLRTLIVDAPAEMNLVWGLRKSGLSLLTGCAGPAKPVTCIEDAAVRPEQLPTYVAGLESILKPLGVRTCYYGHAASGLLHVRPVLELHTREDVAKMRQIAGDVSAHQLERLGVLADGDHEAAPLGQLLHQGLGDLLGRRGDDDRVEGRRGRISPIPVPHQDMDVPVAQLLQPG